MSDAEKAFAKAEKYIREAAFRGELELSFDHTAFRTLDRLPPDIGSFKGIETLDLSRTMITDLTPLAGLTGLRSLMLEDTPVADLGPISRMVNLLDLNLDGTKVVDLRPIVRLGKLGNAAISRGLKFNNVPATKLDSNLAKLAKSEIAPVRGHETLAYLKTLPPWPMPYLPDEAPDGKQPQLIGDGFLRGIVDSVVAAKNAELEQSISFIHAALGADLQARDILSKSSKYAAELHQQIVEMGRQSASHLTLIEGNTEALGSLHDKLAGFEEDAKNKIQQVKADFASTLKAAELAFTEGNAIAAPVQLWADKQGEHEDSRFWAFWLFVGGLVVVSACAVGIVGVLILVPGLIDGLFTPIGCDTAKPETCRGFSLRGWLAVGTVLTVFTVLLWFTRLQMKLYLAERHLVLDARERRAFAQTYVGLLKQGDTSVDAQQQRAMVYAALFRPASDGTVKEEGGLDPALTAALSRFLSK